MSKILLKYISVCPPKKVRIKSERLCLDYTFEPMSSQRCISIGDMLRLAQEQVIDLVMLYFDSDNGAYYVDELADGKRIYLNGWYNAELFEDGMPDYPDAD